MEEALLTKKDINRVKEMALSIIVPGSGFDSRVQNN